MRISDWSSDVCSSDLIAVGSVTNGEDIIQAEDPTMTGSIWNSARIYLGKTANVGFTLPLRGPGGASPPAAGDWVPGRVFQAGGWAAGVTAAQITGPATELGREACREIGCPHV